MFDYPSVLEDIQQKVGDGRSSYADALRLVVDLAYFKVDAQLVIFVEIDLEQQTIVHRCPISNSSRRYPTVDKIKNDLLEYSK